MNLNELPHRNAALAIFPSVDGFGWMLFDGPLSFVNGEVCMAAKVPGAKNERCLRRVEQLLNEFRPGHLVLEAFEGPGTKRGKRVGELCRSIIALATTEGAAVRVITRKQIAACFVSRPQTRYDVALVIAKHLVAIRHLLPKKRRAWEGEFPDMARFAAAALLIVHYANPAEPL